MRPSEDYPKDAFDLADQFLNNLKKGDQFLLRGKEYFIKAIGKHTVDGKNTPEQKTITIISESRQVKLFHITGQDWSGNPKSHPRSADVRQRAFLRDLEGELILDLLNINNKLHEPSDIYKMSIKKPE